MYMYACRYKHAWFERMLHYNVRVCIYLHTHTHIRTQKIFKPKQNNCKLFLTN